jgi:ribosomal protein S18 acetylase RimI-like enzyme
MTPVAHTGLVRLPADAGETSVSGGATIRPIVPGDREGLERIIRATGVFSEEEVQIALELIDAVLTRPGQRDYIIRVYADGEGVQGYYCVGPTPATESTYDLYWIAVDPGRHGRGVGTALQDHAEDLIRSCGGRLVIAETSSRPHYENTRMFYCKRGYTELSRIRDYYRRGDDLVVYGKYLS